MLQTVKDILITLQPAFLALHVILAAAIIGFVLMQRSEGGGLGMGGQQNAFMSVRGQKNLLTRTTAILAGGFFATSFLLALLAAAGQTGTGFMQVPPASSSAPAAGTAPSAPTIPQAPTR